MSTSLIRNLPTNHRTGTRVMTGHWDWVAVMSDGRLGSATPAIHATSLLVLVYPIYPKSNLVRELRRLRALVVKDL